MTEAPICRHHWRIDPPEGPTSEGLCRRCGERRTFLNSGGQERRPSDAERAAIIRARRQERALEQTIFNMGSGDGLGRFRRAQGDSDGVD